MLKQSQILRTLSQSESRLKAVLLDGGRGSRRAVVRRVCEAFQFVDARGRLQEASCSKALEKLAVRGQIELPDVEAKYGSRTAPRLLQDRVPMPSPWPDTLQAVRDLRLIRVDDAKQRAIWNRMMADEHPRGTTMFFGAQVRYLVHSAQGYLGAVGFSAAALQLAARDRYMAWSEAQRDDYLHHVVCLSRFLMRAHCKHLASCVLGGVLRRLPKDFEAIYGYQPWMVETYVDPQRSGTCFKAANFLHVGYTSGRRDGEPAKALWMYELSGQWRRPLGVDKVELYPTRAVHEMLDSDRWVEAEFGDAPLDNKLRSVRLVRSASLMSEVTGKPITRNTRADRAAVKGHYRFLASDPDSAVTPTNILAPHRQRTIERMRGQKTVLCIQDGRKLRYPTRPGCEGLTVIGRNQTKAKTRGMHLHTTLATTETGMPLGVLRCAYSPNASGPLPPKSQYWLDGYLDICEAVKTVSRQHRVVCVMDREADNIALFDAQRQQGRVEILTRARVDRKLAKDKKLYATIKGAPSAGKTQIEIKRVTRRLKSSRKQARPGRTHRIASAEVRYKQVLLPATTSYPGIDPVPVWVVHIKENHPPPGEQAVEWILLTSLRVNSLADALEVLDYYVKRWRIEDFFRVLKSGCKVERLQLRSSLRMSRAIAIYCVIAWRVMVLTLLGRTVGDLEPETFFTEMEIRFAKSYAQRIGQPGPNTLQAAILLVAILGGYQNRTRDGPPGYDIMWLGLERLVLTTFGYELRDSEQPA